MVVLAMRSAMVLGILFALVFAVGTAVLYYLEAPLWLAVVFAVLVMGLQYLVSPWLIQLLFKIEWKEPHEMPAFVARILQDLASRHRIKAPRFGIIPDGNPNAFTFGHYPGNARIVITQGLLDMCQEKEVEAVLAHEFGHVVHWDFVVMTIAATLVMVLYYIYVFGRYSRSGRGRNGGAVVLVAIGAYIAYVIAEYLVLFLSRTREYYADRYSAEVTSNPNALGTALVKIAYGLARSGAAAGVTVDGGGEKSGEEAKREAERARLSPMRGFRTMGVFDPKMGASMALAAAGSYASEARAYRTEVMVKAMEWDLFNPWAWICELSSSHPLPAKRIRALANYAQYVGQRPIFEFPQRARESYWDEFVTDLLVYYLPFIAALVGAGVGIGLAAGAASAAKAMLIAGAAILGAAIGYLTRLRFMYSGARFPRRNVSDLVSEVKVSAIRCIPAELEGKVIGRGIPGLYWSEDLVIEDDTGFMVLDYRQPLGLLEFLFGLFRAESFVGQRIRVVGWYRRFPKPYLEAWKIYTPDGKVNTCWTWWLAKLAGAVLLVIGLVLLFIGFGMAMGV
jgi:Zn-dependent protease with chaperone function